MNLNFNKSYFSGSQCRHRSLVVNSGPNITMVTMEDDMSVSGTHLITYKNIGSVQDCINICHMTKY